MRHKIKNKIFDSTARSIGGLRLFASILCFGVFICAPLKSAEARCHSDCVLCVPADTAATAIALNLTEDLIWEPIIEDNIIDHLNSEENWIVEDFFEDFWVKGLAELTEFLSAFSLYQVEVIGTFFDATNQIDTQRLFFQLQAEAHKDYQPSDDFCWFGTNTRSLAASENRALLNISALSARSMQRQLGYGGSSASSSASDANSRWKQFTSNYCNPKDNGWLGAGTGLDMACNTGGSYNPARTNKDIDYTRLIENPRTLAVDFSNPALAEDEEDVIALANNLYGHDVLSGAVSHEMLLNNTGAQKLYMDLRSVAAKRNVAENSFNAIVAMKSEGAPGGSGSYIAAIMKDLMPTAGSPSEQTALEKDIQDIMGENPSYYAQLEILSKKIYQNPDFFANLYDTPANVERKSVAMKAVDLMLDRALFESELRQEMVMSVMLSNELNKRVEPLNNNFKKGKSN